MKNPVIIKGNKEGIRMIIANEASFDEIKESLDIKFQSKRRYYTKSKPIDITFEGKILTDDEIKEILSLLQEKGLNINNKATNTTKECKDQSFTDLQTDKDGLFYIGNLKTGQSINAATSIIIVGNIEQGASVVSKGNIIVIGELKGFAKAGVLGSDNAFVYKVD